MISFIIPAYNAEKYIIEAISSIDLKENFEIIVVNDGSKDNTLNLIEQTKVTIVTQENMGLAHARNNGAKVAKGDILIFLDSDDKFIEGSLEKILSFYQKDSIVRGRAIEFYSPDLPHEERQKIGLKKQPFYGLITGCLIPREIFTKVGGFDTNVEAGEAIQFSLKAKDLGIKFIDSDIDILHRRIHDSNFGRTKKNIEFENYLKILKTRLKK